jgi:glycosyltransferase involved in cell wall biosynthesis
VRLAVYTDFAYRSDGSRLYADEAFVLFLNCLAEHVDRLVVLGRLDPEFGRNRFPVAPQVRFAPLPYYQDLTSWRAIAGMLGAVPRLWRVMGDVDGILLFGPHPMVFAAAGVAALRRGRIALGVRQDFPRYVRARRPDRYGTHALAMLLDGLFRGLARAAPVVAVGESLAQRYGRARAVLPVMVSLVRETDVMTSDQRREDVDRAGEVRVLSVGRLDPEKNPLLLADVLARLNSGEGRWRLLVCGEGSLRETLATRLEQLGVADSADLLGYVPFGDGLRRLYDRSDVLLHVSWTEGVPQVLLEAFAARLPVVATAVGGVARAAGDAALLVPPGDAEAAAAAVSRLFSDSSLRRRIVLAGAAQAQHHTADAECRRIVAFLRRSWGIRRLTAG